MTNDVLEVIINLIKGVKSGNCLLDNNCVNEDVEIFNCKYLLNQTLRLYRLKYNHIFVSKNAGEIWRQISGEDILNYRYTESVRVENDTDIVVPRFRGGENNPFDTILLNKGKTFTYKDVFTDEHIVPINVIINELLSLKELTYESVIKVLDKIYICKMLKSEDRAIKNKRTRSDNYLEVINTDYKEAGIEVYSLIDFYKHNLEEAEKEYEKLLKLNDKEHNIV